MIQIEDKGTLSAFLEKRGLWFSWYEATSKDPNTIQNQIHSMILSEMSYRVLLKEREHLNETDLAAAPVVTSLLHSGYFSAQILAVRRLFDSTDKENNKVLSLRRVLNEIKNHRHLLTREIFVSFDETPYDPGLPDLAIPGMQPHDSPFSNYSRSTQRHEMFDALSRVLPGERSRFDRIHESIFSRLDNWLASSGGHSLVQLSHKYLAHAADPKSKGDVGQASLSFAEIEKVQKAIVRVSRAIFDVILSSGVYSPVVPMVPLDFLGKVYDANSMVESTSRMQQHWDEMAETRNAWPSNLRSDLHG